MATSHAVSDHIGRALGLLPNGVRNYVREALSDLLTELHEDAGQDRAARTIDKIERVAADLGIEITHGDLV